MMEAVNKAFELLGALDPDLLSCVEVSLVCSLTATALALLAGTPLAVLLGRKRFAGRTFLLAAANTGMAVPTVVIGLLGYGLLSRSGPLGAADILYTRTAIVVGEFVLSLPIIVALGAAAAAGLDPRLEMTARTLGAGRIRTFGTVLREARGGFIAATMSAFGRNCSELGIAMMIGGNIKAHTRTMTTAIAVETAGGEFALALALWLILLLNALGINGAAQVFRLPSMRPSPNVL